MLRLLLARSRCTTVTTLVIGSLAICWTPVARTEVFRCVEAGKTLYQDTPCRTQGRAVDITNARVPEGAADKANAALDRLRTSATAQENEQRSIESAAEIGRLERQLAGYERAEEAELAPLRSTLGYMNFNTAAAVWERAETEESIRRKMQAVLDQYEWKKQAVRERIAQLRAPSGTSPRPAPSAAR